MKNKVLSLTAAALALGAGTIAIAQHQGGRHGPDADADGSVTRAEMSAHAGTMFARLDANSDGVIDAADREARKGARFARLDADGDGEITQTEMDARAERMTERRPERAERMQERGAERFAGEAREARGKRGGNKMGRGGRGRMMMGMGMMRRADADGDRSITRAEFDAAVESHFATIDTDGDGAISATERQARAAMRERMQERRAARQTG